LPYIGNPIYQSAFVTDTFSGNGSTTAFTMSVAPAGTTNVLVAISGVLQDPSTYGVVGTTITFSSAPPTGTGNISCRYLGIPVTGVTTTAYRTVTEFTSTAGQTTFTPPSYTVGFINVYRNGVLLGSADYTASNGTTVVLTTGATAGDLVTVESFLVSSVLNAIPATTGSVGTTYLAGASVTQDKLGTGVAGNGPAFSAWLSGSQTLASATLTKLQFNTEEFDTASCFNNTGSTVSGIPAYAFLPNVAGYYQVNGRVQATVALTQVYLAAYKNGALFKDFANTPGSVIAANGSCLIYLNGSTDYIELYGYFGTGQAVQNANSAITYFQASLARAA